VTSLGHLDEDLHLAGDLGILDSWTISLGICAIPAVMPSELREGLYVSVRQVPLLTGVNGLLMARRSSSDLRQGSGLIRGRSNPNRIKRLDIDLASALHDWGYEQPD
jgi:hypothetical protein